MHHGADTWSGALALYQTAMLAAGRADGTIRLHLHYLSQLRALYALPWEVSTADLRVLMATPHWSPETRKSCRAALRGFYRWGHGEGLTDDDPALGLATVRVPPGQPRPTPPAVVRELLRHPEPRITLMAMLAAYGGLRVGEISRTHRRDLLDGVLTVHGKGGKEREVPITDPWLRTRLEGVEGWAFPTLPDHWTGHTLRHRAATSGLGETGNLLAVMRFLGHSRPDTTIRYTKLRDDALWQVASAAVAGVA